MNPELAKWIGKYYYNNRYESAVSHYNRSDDRLDKYWIDPKVPIRFIHCTYPEQRNSRMASYFNMGECQIISEIVNQLISDGIHASGITILTGYFVQTIHIQDRLFYKAKNQKGDLDTVTISTINGYQGRENDYIILSCVRSNKEHNVGFMSNEARINVALSRAKYGLIIVGNAFTMGSTPVWKSYFNYLRTLVSRRMKIPLVFGDFQQCKFQNLQVSDLFGFL